MPPALSELIRPVSVAKAKPAAPNGTTSELCPAEKLVGFRGRNAFSRGAMVRRPVSGALMLYDGWFAQVLEGPQAAVEALYAKIKQDARHATVRLYEATTAP